MEVCRKYSRLIRTQNNCCKTWSRLKVIFRSFAFNVPRQIARARIRFSLSGTIALFRNQSVGSWCLCGQYTWCILLKIIPASISFVFQKGVFGVEMAHVLLEKVLCLDLNFASENFRVVNENAVWKVIPEQNDVLLETVNIKQAFWKHRRGQNRLIIWLNCFMDAYGMFASYLQNCCNNTSHSEMNWRDWAERSRIWTEKLTSYLRSLVWLLTSTGSVRAPLDESDSNWHF